MQKGRRRELPTSLLLSWLGFIEIGSLSKLVTPIMKPSSLTNCPIPSFSVPVPQLYHKAKQCAVIRALWFGVKNIRTYQNDNVF